MQFYKKTKILGSDFEVWLQSETVRNFEADYLEIETLVNSFEQAFSRFVSTSELSQFNESSGAFQASSEFIQILKLAQSFFDITKGIFNPAIGKSLEILGYKKSFPFSVPRNVDNKSHVQASFEIKNFENIIIDEVNSIIRKPQGIKIDFGGIGKGYVVDKIVEMVREKKYKNFWISAGGDLYVSGLMEDGKNHLVGVQNPLQLGSELFDIRVGASPLAIATSGVGKRHWEIGDNKYHHIIDPRTGLSAVNNMLSTTVIADTVVKADVFAKTAYILGAKKGMDFLDAQPGVEGLMIDKDLVIKLSRNMKNYLSEKYGNFQ